MASGNLQAGHVIVLSLTSDKWLYLLVSCPKLVLGQPVQIQLMDWAEIWDFRTRPIIIFIIFWDFLIFWQFFFSAQVKRSVVISNKRVIYEIPDKLQSELRLRILGKFEISRKYQKLIQWQPCAQASYPNGNFVNTEKKLLKNIN